MASFRIITLVLLSLLPCMAMAQAQDISVEQGVPQGFEQLNAPRPTQITVYYGGDVLGQFKAHYSPDSVQFDEPAEVLKAIPNLKQSEILTAEMQKPLPANANLMCTKKRVTDCGFLATNTIGVIFDQAQLSAEIFVNKQYLPVTDNSGDRYLPLPKRQLASVYGFSGAATGTDTNKPNFTLTNEAIHSFGEMKLNTSSTIANSGLRFDTVAASVDRNGWNGTTGLFRSRASDLIADRDIAGVSVSTSRRTVLDEHKNEGNDVIVYLPRRSFVSIYREGRLYSSHAYEAGNQQIDTTELPEGAYNITLRIQEADGSTRDENRFFVKAQEIPPPGKPLYYAQAGVIRETAASDSSIPQLTSDPIVRMGTVHRITDNLGLNVNVVGVRDRALVEAGNFLLLGSSRVNASVLGSSKGDMGIHVSYQKMMQRFNIAVDGRQMWMKSTPMDSFDMTGDLMQGTAIANYMITDNVTAGMRGSYTKQMNMWSTTSFGPFAEWRIWEKQENVLSMNVSAARTDERNEGNIYFTFTKRFGKFGMNNTIGTGAGGNSKGPFGNSRIWHDNESSDNNVIVGGGVSADENHQIINSDADWQNDFGRVRGTVQEALGNQNSFGYGGNFSFNAAQTKDEFHLGGNQNDRSAVIISTKGDTEGRMNILVNGIKRGTVKVGDKQVVYLNPYHTYRIRLEPENASMLDFDNRDRKVIVYPGNVVKLAWDVKKFYVVVAHLVSEDQKPLSNAILKESREQITTTGKGYLQAELPLLSTLNFTTEAGKSCQVTLPNDVQPKNGILVYKQALTCRATAGQL